MIVQMGACHVGNINLKIKYRGRIFLNASPARRVISILIKHASKLAQINTRRIISVEYVFLNIILIKMLRDNCLEARLFKALS
jgi:hypothetical protein